MKQRLSLLIITLLAFANSFATTYYIKFTASDGTIYWPKLELVWNSRYSSYDTFSLESSYKNMEGGLDFDEVWTNAGGNGTKKTVNEIASGAFFNFSKLTSVSGTSVKKLCNQAFQQCSSLKNVNFPNLQTIENCAFAYCSSLVSYKIPASVTSIAGDAFYHSVSLTNLTVDPNNNYYSCENNILYNKYKTALYAFLSSRNNTEFVVPSTIKTIGANAFYCNWTLKSVIISNGIEAINEKAFYSSQIKSVLIPNSINKIGHFAFSNCKYLESIKIFNPTPITLTSEVFPNTATLYVPKGSKEVFENANYWKNVSEIKEYIPSSVIQFADATVKSICVNNWDFNGDGELDEEEVQNVKEIGTQFMNNTEITSFDELQYFTNLTHIAAFAFSGCTNLNSIKVPSSLTTIGNNAFQNTAWFNAQPDGLLYIGNVLYAYRGTMPANTKIIVKDGTTSICDNVFKNKTGLIGIELPNSLVSIGTETEGYVFYGCTGLTEIKIPAGVKSIVKYAFSSSGLESIELPKGLESIGNSSFRSCNSLESIVIPDNVKTIGKNTFRDCTKLQSVTMPSCLMSVAEDAFRDCNQLKRVDISNIGGWCNIDFTNYRANPLFLAHHLYVNGKELVHLETSPYYEHNYYSEGVLHTSSYNWGMIKPYALYGCQGLKTVSITNNITSIGINAFSSCTSLKAVKTASQPFILNSNAFPTKSNVKLFVPKGYLEQYQKAEVWNTFKQVKGYPDVDVNEDDNVDVVDVVDITRHVIGTPSDAFSIFLADINNDKEVDLDDAKQAINSVAYSSSLNAIEPDQNQPNRIWLENFEVRARKTCCASVVLENTSDNLVGFQIDVTLPEGISLNSNLCRLSNRVIDKEQQLTITSLGNNTYRFTSVSLSLQSISGKDGELITLSLNATNLTSSGNITISNIRLVTANSERVVLQNVEFKVQPIEYQLFSSGEGTEEKPYLLFDSNDFLYLAKDVNGGTSYEGVFFKVEKPEIDFSGVTYTPIGKQQVVSNAIVINAFAGSFDGNNVVIKNLSSSKGLFGYLAKGSFVGNITIDNSCSINGTSSNTAAIANISEGTISNCINKANISSTGYHIGGICGDNMGIISNCKNYGKITGKSDSSSGGMIGGIAGDTDGGSSSNLHNAIIRDCENYGDVSSPSFEVGGIVGFATTSYVSLPTTGEEAIIERCMNKGNVIGEYSVGGIVGNTNSTTMIIGNNIVISCTITGTNSSGGSGAGTISSSYNSLYSNNFYTKDVVLIVGNQTYDGTTPRGVWGYDSTTHNYLPKDITENCGAILLTEGDINTDGQTTAQDASLVLQHVAGKTPLNDNVKKAADVNGDGEVTAQDASLILQKVAGK